MSQETPGQAARRARQEGGKPGQAAKKSRLRQAVDTVGLKKRMAVDSALIHKRETNTPNAMVGEDGVDHYDRAALRAREDTLNTARSERINDLRRRLRSDDSTVKAMAKRAASGDAMPTDNPGAVLKRANSRADSLRKFKQKLGSR